VFRAPPVLKKLSAGPPPQKGGPNTPFWEGSTKNPEVPPGVCPNLRPHWAGVFPGIFKVSLPWKKFSSKKAWESPNLIGFVHGGPRGDLEFKEGFSQRMIPRNPKVSCKTSKG